MKHKRISAIFLPIIACMLFPACEKDDSDFSDYDFSKYTLRSENGEEDNAETTLSDTISLAIDWSGLSVTVSGETNDSVTVITDGGDVTITSTITARYLEVTVSGETTDGSLLVYSEKAWGLVMNGVSITNQDGPAVNNQCGKWLYITLADGTENALTDGTVYADAPKNVQNEAVDQKGTLFSEGQINFNGNGLLTVNGNAKNGIASDDYIVIDGGSISIDMAATGSNGVKVNDGMTINGGTLTVSVKADGARGIKSDAFVSISGGNTTITTIGDCKIETTDGITDTTSCAGIKCDSLFTMTAGQLNITSTGDGGKGINSGLNVEFSGGTLTVVTKGSNDMAKPKGIKSDTGIIVSGGSFSVSVNKSWACDNGSDDDDPTTKVTVNGSPSECKLEKKNVKIVY